MAEQKLFPPLSPSMLRTWGNTLPLSGTGQLTMDIALTITLVIFISAFISAGLVIQFTTIRKLKEKIREQEEKEVNHYDNAHKIYRDLRQELNETQLKLRWVEAEKEVRKFLMRDPQRMRELAQAGHLDRQNWMIQQGTEIIMKEDDIYVTTRLIEWWGDKKADNFNI